jgi:hypothetical protein
VFFKRFGHFLIYFINFHLPFGLEQQLRDQINTEKTDMVIFTNF